ncbi:MAG TPA: ATP-dependent DNA helicase UvrD2 [Gaiellaceae bacterium]|nr:ATP-dependent DNA helicase UvrD2 [Gaiellaceae bacterium]
MDSDAILAVLNPEQRRAAELVRGPVCILAGAGTGKTTTITRRIANQVATGAFAPGQILAVTFTDKAAGEMRNRLAALGATGVQARTFHSAALAQLRHFSPDAVGRILPSKALTLRRIANSLPAPFKFRPAGDLATEIEWARNRRITPERYRSSLGDHQPPIPSDLMQRVYAQYDEVKQAQGLTDFEDLLELTIRLYDANPDSARTFRERYLAFTVDEYQDVNLLQQTLLERWLGDRDELCAVGDDNQAIYGFTGASPSYLLALPQRFPDAAVVRLEQNYRSTEQVLALANRLAPPLRTELPPGPEPDVRPVVSVDVEAAVVVERIRAATCPLEEVAILCRTNARLADFEQVLHEAGVPFQGASFLGREAARFLLRRLTDDGTPVAGQVRAQALAQGWQETPADGLGEREQIRQDDLTRLVGLAESLAPASVSEFKAELERRFGDGGDERRGVHLLTYHAAKGLEFELVFLPRLEERELPAKQAKTDEQIAEERRLLYVGITRAKRELVVTWVKKPSRFLEELGFAAARSEPPAGFEALKAWRLARSREDDVPAYLVFHNTTLEEIAARKPTSMVELAAVPGVGPAKLERYGEGVLAALAAG